MRPAELLWRAGCAARLPLDYIGRRWVAASQRHQPAGTWWLCDEYPLTLHQCGVQGSSINVFDLAFPPDFSFDWHRDYRHEKSAPRTFSPGIDIRDPDVVGDVKYIWEINRHQHLSQIAYSARPDAPRVILDALRSWIDQNSYLVGVNWASSLELALRMISWAMLYPRIRPAFAEDRCFRESFAASVHLHLGAIRSHLSRYSSANNHLIGELAGLYIGALCFPWWPVCEEWRQFGRNQLEREIRLQFTPEGINREQAMSYQLFTMELVLAAMLVGRNAGESFGRASRERMRAALSYLERLATASGDLPWYGDSDDARGFLLSSDETALQVVMQLGALVFDEPRFARFAPRLTAAARALMPGDCPKPQNSTTRVGDGIQSQLFPEGGVAVVANGDSWKLAMDVGPLGFTSIAAHGHADALSVLLAIDGQYMLVDSGTYAYHSHPGWRTYFRGTAAHNTVRVDGQDQSVMAGRFLWSRSAATQIVGFDDNEDNCTIVGEHDGYARLADPVIHRRRVDCSKKTLALNIEDTVTCHGLHDVEVHWHLHEEACVVATGDAASVCFRGRYFRFVMNGDGFVLEATRGRENPILGWRSSRFNRKVPITTLRFAGRVFGTATLRTTIAEVVSTH